MYSICIFIRSNDSTVVLVHRLVPPQTNNGLDKRYFVLENGKRCVSDFYNDTKIGSKRRIIQEKAASASDTSEIDALVERPVDGPHTSYTAIISESPHSLYSGIREYSGNREYDSGTCSRSVMITMTQTRFAHVPTPSSSGTPVRIIRRKQGSARSVQSRHEDIFCVGTNVLRRRRGVSRGSTETEDLLPNPLNDPLSNFFSVYRDDPLSKEDSQTPVTSGRSSPTELGRASNFGWATGNTTERSSLYSSYSWADDVSWGDEYDRRASSNVRSLFEEIDSVLFAESSTAQGSAQSSARSQHLQKECQEWMSQFPHLRICGKGVSAGQDLGFQAIQTEPTPQSADVLLTDVTETSQQSPNSQDTQSLVIQGKHVIVKLAPRSAHPAAHSAHQDVPAHDPWAFLHEEVLAQDGYYEEVIALDYKTEDELVSARHPHRARAARRGLPPLTPNACVRDSVMSMTFDIAWSEIVSWMREIIRLYIDYLLTEPSSKQPIPPLEMGDLPVGESQLATLPLEAIGGSPLTRDNSFAKLERRVPTAGSYFSGQSSQALAGVLTISTKALQSREKSNLQDSVEQPQSSREAGRPGSSLNRLVNRPSSVKVMDQVINRLSSARKAPASRVRLAPLDSRAKTPNIEEDLRKEMGNQVLVGRRLQMFPERQQTQQTNNDRLNSPSYMFRSALPPIGLVESADSIHTGLPQRNQRSNLKQYMSNRASSALAEKDIRQPRERERSLIMPLDNRPSTTHTFRSDTPFALGRRSSTPMGFSAARGTLQSSNYVSAGPSGVSQLLKIAGSGIGGVGGVSGVGGAHQEHQLDEGEEETFHDLQTWGSAGNAGSSLPIRRGRQLGLSSVVR